MSFLTQLILFLYISAAFGRNQFKYPAKPFIPVSHENEKDYTNKRDPRLKNNAFETDIHAEYTASSTDAVTTFKDNGFQLPSSFKLKNNVPQTLTANKEDRHASIITIMSKTINANIKPNGQDHKTAEIQNFINKTPKFIIKNNSTPSPDTNAELTSNINIFEDLSNYTKKAITESDGKRNARSTDDEVIVSRHNNMLNLLLDVANMLTQFNSTSLSQRSGDIVSAISVPILSALFGPNVNVLWPMFLRIAVMVMKLLT